MDSLERWAAAITLRDRWKDRVTIAEQRLRSATISESERALEERERAVYETVLHELITRLQMPE